MKALLALAALLATAAPCQTVAGQSLDAISQAAADAQAKAKAASDAAAAAQAAIPPVCTTTPAGDTLNGTVGNSTACTPPANNTRPTAVQSGNTTLAADCTFSITFARSFTSSTPFIYAAVVDNTNTQMPCKIKTRSSSGGTGVCAQAQSTVLSLSIVTSGITLLPFGSTCTAGTPVMFVGREPTQ